MQTKPTSLLLMLILSAGLLSGCSGVKPSELPLDDAAQALGADAQVKLRAAQEEFHRKCEGALAFKSVAKIERPEPGGFADEEFRHLTWPDWVEDDTPKALILYSRSPDLMQVRFNNRWMPLADSIALRSSLADNGRVLVAAQRPDAAALASAQALVGGCPAVVRQGWLTRWVYDGFEEARDTVNDYALPGRHWYTNWYYTAAFDPLLNGFLLVSSLFGFSSSMLIIFPLTLVLCLDKKGVEFLTKAGLLPVLGVVYVVAKFRPAWVKQHAASIFAVSGIALSLAVKGFRQLLGLPSYAVLCIALLGRPEDILTAQNHLYSWMPASALSHIPLHGSVFGSVSPLAPAGWIAGLVYLLASCINQADNIYKTVQLYDTDKEVLEQRLGVLSWWVAEEQEQGEEVLNAWLKQLWRTILFSVVIALAPLALSLYFVIKAAADAVWVLASVVGAKTKLSVPKVLRALPHAALLAVLIVAYSKLPVAPTVALASQPAAPPATAVTVASKAVQLREQPTAKARVVGRLKRGEEAQVIGNSNSWAQVRLGDGTVGYVPGNSISSPSAPREPDANRLRKRRRASRR
ncbi:MAG TPA: SH3 domain-containing protein [Pyrinomonadaceae bacterium]|nr:SH3 domain-containing protein [Pyrinomonadaceae bacterium]